MRTPDYQSLNESQLKAVCRKEGPLLLLAGPGSGKTTVIVNRVLHLLSLGISPESILVITFTNAAALSMKNKYTSFSDGEDSVYFGTFHSFFYSILRSANQYHSLKIITSQEKKKILRTILKKYSNQTDSYTDLEEDINKVISALSFYKNTGEWSKLIILMPQRLKEHTKEILEQYQELVRQYQFIDFDDMLYECKKLLTEDEDLRQKLQKRFQFLMIDEFQDINPIQYEVIKMLFPAPANIVAVGDDDQSIYGFRGSKPDIMKQFQKEYHADTLCLEINYRCTEEIVKASCKMIEGNRNRFRKPLRAHHKKDPQSFRIKAFPERQDQANYLLSMLSEYQGKHKDDQESIAVLFRTNAYMQGTAARLSAAGIPFSMKEKVKSIYDHFIIKDMMAYFALAQGEWNREAVIRILNRPYRYIGREAIANSNSMEQLKEYYGLRQKEKGYYSDQIHALEQLEKQLILLKRMSPLPGISYILKGIGYDKYLKATSAGKPELANEWNEILDFLKEDAGQFTSVEIWKEAQDQYLDKLNREKKGENEEATIRLMTVHAAKGLEFDTVIIPDCNDKVYPHGTNTEEEFLEEERRILYVGMTRAKNRLELLYLEGTQNRQQFPSRYLRKLIKK